MNAILKMFAVLLCATLVAGCGSGEQKNTAAPKPQEPAAAAPAEPKESSEAVEMEEEDDGHHDPVNLGTQTIGNYTVEVVAYGGIEPGHDGDVDVDIDGGTPKAVRAWVGLEDAVGVVKSRAEAEGDGHYHVHVDVAEELPEGAQFWIELEEENGEVLLISFAI